jgi:hypothetical protein
MGLNREADGSLEVAERPVILRMAALVGAVAVPWAVLESAPVQAPRDPLRVVLGFVAGAFLLVVALLAESRWLRFDRRQRVLHWRRSRLLSTRAGALPFSAISSAVAQPRLPDDASGARRLTYTPVLVTTKGEIPLSGTSSLQASDYAELLAAVREAVGLETAEEAVAGLVEAGRIVDAVALARRLFGLSLEEATARVERLRRGP